MYKKRLQFFVVYTTSVVFLTLCVLGVAAIQGWNLDFASAQQTTVSSSGVSEDAALAARLKELTPEERINVNVYEKCNKSAVNINTKFQRYSMFSGPREIEADRGSGIIIDKKGHVLTNFHVVEGSESVQVTLFNGKSYTAEKIGDDPATDIAVLKIDAPTDELFPVVIADSSKLLVGQQVYAIGNPFGLERTLTSGIISSLNRTIGSRARYRPIKQAIQIDAAINPGNSGGPLLDSKGRMIGMNTAIASRVGENSGVGFAIPTNTIMRIVSTLLKNGKVVRGDAGIPSVLETPEGLMIVEVTPEGPAERAGLQGPKIVREKTQRGNSTYYRQYTDTSVADTIVAVEDKSAKTAEDFLATIEEKKPGDTIMITVLREGKELKVPVVLE